MSEMRYGIDFDALAGVLGDSPHGSHRKALTMTTTSRNRKGRKADPEATMKTTAARVIDTAGTLA